MPVRTRTIDKTVRVARLANVMSMRIAKELADWGANRSRELTSRPNAKGNNPSLPGESPKWRTMDGRNSITSVRKQGGAAYGFLNNVPGTYMTYHELGIEYPKGFQQRPTLVPAFHDLRLHAPYIAKRYS